jgi:hypothetical protein
VSVCCICCVLSGRGLCDELITRPEESYRLWRVVVCDHVTSWYEEAIAGAWLQSQRNNNILPVVRGVFNDFFGSSFNCCLLETLPSINMFTV